MPEQALRARSPLAALLEPGRFGNAAASGVSLSEVAGRGLATVIAHQGKTVALAAAARAAFGCDLPTTPRRVAGKGVAFLWAGPDQWLAMFDPAPRDGTETALESLRGLAAIIDQSDARAIVRIAGPDARAALAKGVPVDLHERSFKPGNVAATLVAGIHVQLWQVDATPTYEIACARSFAGSFLHWLKDSCAAFGYTVTPVGSP